MTPFGKRPLTPLSRAPRSSRSRTFVRADHVRCSEEGQGAWVGREGRPPRSPSLPVREDQQFWMTRGAFHRQGPFVGSGGHYSPGPAIVRSALRRCDVPLDDALTSPWAFSQFRSVMSEAIRGGDSSFRISAHPRRVTVLGRGDLGPRSLASAALFGARVTSFFETRRRLSTSATAYDVRARTSSSRVSSLGRAP